MIKQLFMPRRTIGGLTLYQRIPKTVGEYRYAVGTSTVKDIRNFKSYAKAIAWMKERKAEL